MRGWVLGTVFKMCNPFHLFTVHTFHEHREPKFDEGGNDDDDDLDICVV